MSILRVMVVVLQLIGAGATSTLATERGQRNGSWGSESRVDIAKVVFDEPVLEETIESNFMVLCLNV